MFKRKNGRFSPALIVSFIALVMAMAGSAIALPGKGSVDKNDFAKGSVTKKAIKKGAITGKAIKAGAVGTPAIADGSVTDVKLADGSVTGGKVADGSIGAGKLAAGTLPTYAYAFIDGSQAIVPDQSKNMGSATATLEGSFICFNNLPFAAKNISVTTARLGGGIDSSFGQAFAPGVDNTFCAGAEGASVQFYDASGAGSFDATPPRFYVTFQG